MATKKRILIVSEYFYPEAFKINDVAEDWVKKGFEVEVITLQPSYPEGKIFSGFKNKFYETVTHKGVIVHRIRTVQGYKESVVKKVWKYIFYMLAGSVWAVRNGRRFDYVFGHSMAALTAMLPAILIKKIYKKPTTLWVQDVWPESVFAYGFKENAIQVKLLDIFVKYIYGNTDRFALSSTGFRKRIEKYAKPNVEMIYAPNWAEELKPSREKFSFSEEDKVHFTFAGNIGKVQNLENVIDGFLGMDKTLSKKAQLNFIGNGSNLESLKERVKAANAENIVFWGRQERDQMTKFYDASDFLIIALNDSPIFSITVPAKFQTYLAAKRPILAFINGDVVDLVTNNGLGLSAGASDVQKMAEVYEECVNMPMDKRIKYTESSEELLRTTFNRDLIIDNLANLVCR